MRVVGLAYAAIVLLSGLQCLNSARRGRRAYWFAMLDVMAAGSFAILVIAYVTPSVAASIGRAAVVLFVIGLAWTVLSTPHEWRDFKAGPIPAGTIGRVITVASLATIALLVLPAIVIGALAAYASWR